MRSLNNLPDANPPPQPLSPINSPKDSSKDKDIKPPLSVEKLNSLIKTFLEGKILSPKDSSTILNEYVQKLSEGNKEVFSAKEFYIAIDNMLNEEALIKTSDPSGTTLRAMLSILSSNEAIKKRLHPGLEGWGNNYNAYVDEGG